MIKKKLTRGSMWMYLPVPCPQKLGTTSYLLCVATACEVKLCVQVVRNDSKYTFAR